MHDADDLALLRAFGNGHEQAFWPLWLKHSRRLFAICFWEMNRNREDAEDALHEAMLRARERLPRFAASITSPASWLARMTSNVCKDIHRLHARDLRLEANVVVLRPLYTGGSESAPNDCDAAALIARLPDRLRDVFVLRVVQHSSYVEIAARLGLTCATARKRVQQSRAALRAWRDEAAA
ncbi:MAG TPA: sigma-70 family RNA polymerase sigma factor [Thermoanaerobaculia bacterium]|nr:sigma-70 family RNA polymerase sigma factor [Thermoanaerobaculia bacterium]